MPWRALSCRDSQELTNSGGVRAVENTNNRDSRQIAGDNRGVSGRIMGSGNSDTYHGELGQITGIVGRQLIVQQVTCR